MRRADQTADLINTIGPKADIRIVRPFGPSNGAKRLDCCDWIGTKEELKAMIDNAKPYAPLNGGGDNVIPFPGAITAQMAASEVPDQAFAQGSPGLKLLSPTACQRAPIPERKWCVQDYIPHATVTLLSGGGGEGKSLLALQLGAARELGRDWVGLLPEPGRTHARSAEDDHEEMQRRLDAILRFYGAAFAGLADMRVVDLVGEDCILGELAKGRITPTEAYHSSTPLCPPLSRASPRSTCSPICSPAMKTFGRRSGNSSIC
jgi:hypothetical protein